MSCHKNTVDLIRVMTETPLQMIFVVQNYGESYTTARADFWVGYDLCDLCYCYTCEGLTSEPTNEMYLCKKCCSYLCIQSWEHSEQCVEEGRKDLSNPQCSPSQYYVHFIGDLVTGVP